MTTRDPMDPMDRAALAVAAAIREYLADQEDQKRERAEMGRSLDRKLRERGRHDADR